MKLKTFLIALLFCTGFAFTAEFRVETGGRFGLSLTDYFTPTDATVSGGATCVSGIKKVDRDLWCVTIIAEAKGANHPKYFDYYLRVGDVISVFRFPDIRTVRRLKATSLDWNEAVFEVLN